MEGVSAVVERRERDGKGREAEKGIEGVERKEI